MQTIEMFEVITQSQPTDYQSLEILKEAYLKLGRQKDVVNTSKKIAQAYLQLGQLSSAILEYETILQQSPDDPEALAAMAEIESKASNLAATPLADMGGSKKDFDGERSNKRASEEVDDGCNAMKKIFVDGRLISLGDFDASWVTPTLHDLPGKVIEPFVHILAEKAICTAEKSLTMISDKTRLGYLPLERYDIDLELARSFPKETCQRWCVLPFDRMSKSVLVATTNPFNVRAREELQKSTSYRILWYLATPVDLMKAIKKVYR
ncbi:MAG: protein containing ral secretory system [Verrucomicrobiales bacterium]|nr:protein containing ral secretory system [Verrucomicrobiales bacterium]